MNTHLRKLWDSLKSSYWFVPLVMMVLAFLLWLGTSGFDNVLSVKDKKAIAWLYISDAETMRTLLLTIAVAIMGVLGVVFSIIMVPLSIAAAQFGPRLLRTFLRDTGTQITLGTFTATFIFCMAVLLQLSNTVKHPLPQISVNVALLLGFISFGTLIYFINHVSVSLQAPVVVARVSHELHAAISHALPAELGSASLISPDDESNTPAPDLLSPHKSVVAKQSGYLQVRDDSTLLHLAHHHNLVFKLLQEPGDFVAEGMPLAMVWGEINIEDISGQVNAAFITGIQRTLIQDVTFGINELVEVAVRALSQAINDPFTVMTCLDWIGSALCQLCRRTFPQSKLFDHNNTLRIISDPITFTRLAEAALNQIIEYGCSSRSIALKIMATIKVVLPYTTTNEQRKTLLYHAALVESSCQSKLSDSADKQTIRDEYEVVKELIRIKTGKAKSS